MIDHTVIPVSDYERSKAFYLQALAPLGITLVRERPGFGGFGPGGRPEFWIAAGTPRIGTPLPHIAFRVETRALVDAFYRAAIAAGGKDHGAPGVRPHYSENYYGGFVLDPDGYNIEAVCRATE